MHIYIHIPVCIRKCRYCAFYSVPIEEIDIEAVISAIKAELAIYSEHFKGKSFKLPPTLYFGGGTPSLIPPKQIASIIELAGQLLNIDKFSEITLEANPETITADVALQLKSAGINRISIGVQSLDDEILSFLGRIHDAKTALAAIENAVKSGITSVNADIIYATPFHRRRKILNEIGKLIELGVNHFSLYSLSAEPGTPLYEDVQTSKVALPSSDEASEQYFAMLDMLEGYGFYPYEVSNLASMGNECIHNMAYWLGEPYLGIGPSAHSYDGETRWANIDDWKKYATMLLKGEKPLAFSEKLSKFQKIEELVMLRLRLSDGINLGELEDNTRDAILGASKMLIDEGVLVYNGRNLYLPREKRLLADGVALKIITAMKNGTN